MLIFRTNIDSILCNLQKKNDFYGSKPFKYLINHVSSHSVNYERRYTRKRIRLHR